VTNSNTIIINVTLIDAGVGAMSDTLVPESTHTFLGNTDDGMEPTAFQWMKQGIALKRRTRAN
jgi:hypothetical protein